MARTKGSAMAITSVSSKVAETFPIFFVRERIQIGPYCLVYVYPQWSMELLGDTGELHISEKFIKKSCGRRIAARRGICSKGPRPRSIGVP